MNETILRDLFVWRSAIDEDSLRRVVERIARATVPWASPSSRSALELAVGEAALRGVDSEPPLDIDLLYDAIAYQAAVRVSAAVELTQDVLCAIAHALGPDARRRLASELPPAWACLLENTHDVPTDRRPAPTPDRREGRTLASGAPGSSTPLCDAAPRTGQSDSIAGSDDPHGERKLSGSEGPVPRRRTLADGGD